MSQLLDSMKAAKGISSLSYYLIIVIGIMFLLVLGVFIYMASRHVTLESVRAAYPNLTSTRVLYALTACVILFIIFMLINSKYELYFQKRTTIGVDRAIPTSLTFWKPGTSPNPEDPYKLMLTSSEFPMSSPEIYTVGVEIIVGDTRTNDKMGPYRHIIHRGTNELMNFTDPNSAGSAPKGMGDLADGLPRQMNPGIFLDKFTNDLIIFIDTDPIGKGSNSYRESIRIPDIPLKKGFHLHLVVHDRLIEVYINCRLVSTKLLNGNPKGVPNSWYGRIGFSRAAAIIQNLTLWDSSLYAIELRNKCPVIDISKRKIAPTSCSTAGS